MAFDDLFLLLFVSKRGALFGKIVSSTSMMATELGISQQSVSRKLRKLAQKGLIELSSSTYGVSVSVTPKGKKLLESHLLELQTMFAGQKQKSLKGIVESGLGEGKYYLSFPQYKKQIMEKFGFEPYHGTLNLRVSEAELDFFRQNQVEEIIRGFATKERTFGGLRAIPVKISEKLNGALIFPDRSAHPKTIAEVIAPFFLRKKLGLSDGAILTVYASEKNEK